MTLKMLFLVLPIFIVTKTTYAQHFGFSLGYATSSSFFGDLLYQKNNLSFHLGYTHQSSDVKGEKVTDQKPNYGRTVLGEGNYFYSVDFGIGYLVSEKVRLAAEISIGSKEYYINLSDKRFKDDGYHMVDKSDSLIGLGGSASYIIKNWELFISYNSIRELGLGFRLMF